MSHGSTVGVVNPLQVGRRRSRASILGIGKRFLSSLNQDRLTGCGTHSPSFSTATWASFPWLREAGA